MLSLLLIIGLQSVAADTTRTKAVILAQDAATSVEHLIERLEPEAAVLIPEHPILRGRDAARSPFSNRYLKAGVVVRQTPLHTVASTDGKLGCVTGITAMTVPGDTARGPRPGRYITCWRLGSDGAWRIVAHSRNGEAQGLPEPAAALAGAPHSATGRSSSIIAAMAADQAFAKLAVDSSTGIAFGRYSAADGMVLGLRPVPARGPEEIRSRFAAAPPDQQLAWAPRRDLGAAAAGLAVTVGEAESGPRKGGPREGYSKYVTVWREEADGSWKYIFDLGSDRPDPQAGRRIGG
jgi:ketosteroid isomerase-like protein